jgi:GR25 family glycosyltransferase involved in LPS biosynthesis
MLILADYTDIKVTRIPGPKGDEIDPKALPKKLKDIVGPGQLGCWRAHVDAWYRIVEIGLETALILEDDADWDVSFKDELYLLSKALAENGSPLGNHGKYPVTATEPYGSLTHSRV